MQITEHQKLINSAMLEVGALLRADRGDDASWSKGYEHGIRESLRVLADYLHGKGELKL